MTSSPSRRILMALTGAIFGATLAYGSVSYAHGAPNEQAPRQAVDPQAAPALHRRHPLVRQGLNK